MNCRERILKALDHEEPDKVPYWEHLIEQPKLVKLLDFKPIKGSELKLNSNLIKIPDFKKKTLKNYGYDPIVIKPLLNGAQDYFKLYIKLKVDMSTYNIGPYSNFQFIAPDKAISPFGQIFQLKLHKDYLDIYYIGGNFNKENYEEQFSKINTEEPLITPLFGKVIQNVPEEQIYIIPGIFSGLFQSILEGFGIETFSRLITKEKEFMKRVIKDRENLFINIMKQNIDIFERIAFFIGDDLAFNTGPFVSPRIFNEMFLPSYKRLSNIAHKRGIKLIFHSDGDIRPLLDGLIECFDAIHPWQASAHIDIIEIKRQYGDKVCIMGNVPVAMLIHNKPREISIYVKNLLKECAPSGGYFMSSGNSIVPQIPIRNYMAMLRTFWRYRKYPIKVPSF
ncbi:MAG: uroporphyrinogen decarboxylase family protein [Promethearchaeota archaeon]